MKAPLDEELAEKQLHSTKLTQRPVLKTCWYLSMMLLGQLGFEYWLTRTLSIYSIRPVLTDVLLPIAISLPLEALRWWLHRRREQKAEAPIPRDPYWFQVMEGSFAIWLLFKLAIAIRIFVL